MKKKILIFSMSKLQSQFEAERVAEEAKKLGIGAERVWYRDLKFDLADRRVGVRGEEIKKDEVTGMFFRVAGTKSGKYVWGRYMLLEMIGDKIFCVNRESYLRWQRMGKILQHAVFLKAGIPIVRSKIFYTKNQVLESRMGEDWGWPVVVKYERGCQGKSVRKFDDERQLYKWLERIDEKKVGMLLWQEYLPLNWDIRVIVLGGKVLGAMKRTAVGDDFRSNFSLGGKVERWELSLEDKRLAERAAKACLLDYGGVDIMKDKQGKSYVLEVNRQCQFKGFEQATGINVAKAVVRMIKEKQFCK